MDQLEIQPKIEQTLLATTHDVVIDTPDRNVCCFVLRVEVVVDEAVTSELPVAEVQMPACYKLKVVVFDAEGRDVADYPVARK